MTSRATKRGGQPRCPALATVNADVLLTSIAGSEDVRPEHGRLSCELAAGHESSHVAFVAAVNGGDQWWWVRWDGDLDETVEVIQIDPCDAELPQGRYADDCLLPGGHPGPHSFHLPPLAWPPEERRPVRSRGHTP
jgi:hypothetical protein